MLIQNRTFDRQFDIVVVGGGHAGVEAANAAAQMGLSVCLTTMEPAKIALMSCNPAIGGLAKGQLTREIDALGGVMAKAIDATGIQYRMLNVSKGPAVRSPRAQADKVEYARWVGAYMAAVPGLEILEGMAETLLTGDTGIVGLSMAGGMRIGAKAVVCCSGTFLDGLAHIGMTSFPAGRMGEKPAIGLGDSFKALGLETGRLKTGTPPRLDRDSIDWDRLEPQYGDDPPVPFSFETERIGRPQIPCHITYTNERTHEHIRSGFDRSPMFMGVIEGVGPRYCPSVEDKVARFPERDRHQIFLEPEGVGAREIYPNGISTSLPEDVQRAFVRTIPGLERAEFIRLGYAIEYTYCPPRQLDATLEVKSIPGLYFAGQLNATSGYEEAGAQGLMAGINAALKIKGEPPLILRRDEAYIGVLIDDLITKDHIEPYRMFTSRAEYRLALRHDTADRRLTPHGRRIGTIGDARWERFARKMGIVDTEIARLTSIRPDRASLIAQFEKRGLPIPDSTPLASELLCRPEFEYEDLAAFGLARGAAHDGDDHNSSDDRISRDGRIGDAAPDDCASLSAGEAEQVYLHFRYEGYLKKERAQVDRARRLEDKSIPRQFDFQAVRGLRNEARDKFERFRPATLGQASRITGVTPSDVSLLMVALKARAA